MPRERILLDKETPPDIGKAAMLMAGSFTQRTTSPVGAVVPDYLGQMMFVTTGTQWFISTGTTANTDWKAMTA